MLASTLALWAWLSCATPQGTAPSDLPDAGAACPRQTPSLVAETDSAVFTLLGSYPFIEGTSVAVDSVRSLAFVGCGGGVAIVDISNPAAPRVVSTRIRGEMLVRDLALRNEYLYVAFHSLLSGPGPTPDLEVWNVADPVNPSHVADIDLPNPTNSLEIRDTLLVLTCANGLAIYNIAGNMPRRIADTVIDGNPTDAQVEDSLLYVGKNFSPVEIWSIADPGHPRRLSTWGVVDNYPRIRVQNDRLYLTTYRLLGIVPPGLRVYDVSDPTHAQLLGAYDTNHLWKPWNICLHDSLAAISCGDSYGLRILSTADPTDMRLLAASDTACLGFTWLGTLGYAAFLNRFSVMNMQDPAEPSEVGSVPVNRVGALARSPGFVYSLTDRLWVLDQIHYPEIETTGAILLGPNLTSIAVQDSIGVVTALSPSRFAVVHLGDPQRPRLLAVETLPGGSPDVVLAESLCLVANGSDLRVYNLARPASPELIGSLGIAANGHLVINRNGLLFIGGDRLWGINLTDPRNPIQVLDTALILLR